MKKITILGMIAAALLLSSCATSKVEEAPVAEAPIYDGAWVAEEFVNNDVVMSGATANIELSAPVDGIYELIGNTGVNNIIKTEFTIADGKISPVNTGSLATTMKAGTPEAMAYEAAFIALLGNEADVAVEGDKLVISNATSKITFVPGEPAATPIVEDVNEDVITIEE